MQVWINNDLERVSRESWTLEPRSINVLLKDWRANVPFSRCLLQRLLGLVALVLESFDRFAFGFTTGFRVFELRVLYVFFCMFYIMWVMRVHTVTCCRVECVKLVCIVWLRTQVITHMLLKLHTCYWKRLVSNVIAIPCFFFLGVLSCEWCVPTSDMRVRVHMLLCSHVVVLTVIRFVFYCVWSQTN